jgi:hypothetical protein
MENVKNFDDLINMGAVTKVVKLGTHEIKMRTLGFDEQSSISDNIPETSKDSKKLDILQKNIIAESIVSVDNVVLSKEEKMAMIGKMQNGVVNFLFNQFEIMVGEQSKILEDVKKNSSLSPKTTP